MLRLRLIQSAVNLLIQSKPDTSMVGFKLQKLQLPATEFQFFIYSGSFDCMVPKDLFENKVKVLGKLVTYTNFPDSGHEGFMSEARVIRDLAN